MQSHIDQNGIKSTERKEIFKFNTSGLAESILGFRLFCCLIFELICIISIKFKTSVVILSRVIPNLGLRI